MLARTQPAAAEPAPHPLADSAERQRLAEAVARRDAARADLTRLQDAERRAMQARITASAECDKAEALLEEARSNAPHAYVSALLDGGGNSGSLINQAEDRLNAAQAELRRHREGEGALREAIEDAERRLQMAESGVKPEVSKLIENSPEVTRLIDEYRAARRRAGELAAALTATGVASAAWARDEVDLAIAMRTDISRPGEPPPDRSLAERWKSARAALAEDAQATLPDAAGRRPSPA